MGVIKHWCWCVGFLFVFIPTVHAGCAELNQKILTLPEDTTVGTIIIEVSGVESLRDVEPTGILEVVNTTSGWELKLINAKEIDREKMQQSSIVFNLKCKDAITSREQSCSFRIIVIGVNEYPPKFQVSEFNVTVPESTQVGTSVFTFNEPGHRATDEDVDINPTVIYYWILDGADGYFRISNIRQGTVVVNKALDYEAGPRQFNLTVEAYEAETTERYSDTAVLQINLQDIDDMNPIFFNNGLFTLELNEGVYYGNDSFITSPVISATDGDQEINEQIRFELDNSTNTVYPGLFSVEADGSIRITGSLRAGEYIINVRAYQPSNPELRYAVTAVKVTVRDINNHKPIMSQKLYNTTLSEAASVGTIVLTVSATDQDQGVNGQLEFVLTGDNGDFKIQTSQNQGIVLLAKPLDRETKEMYSMEVFAREVNTTEKYTSESSKINIILTDVNDNAPVFNEKSYSFELDRTDGKGTKVGSVSATDVDKDLNALLTYTLQESTFSPALTIDKNTGGIVLARNLDYTDIGSHDVTVIATDNSLDPTDRRSTAARVTIIVKAVNDMPPMFIGEPYSFFISETAPNNTLIGQVLAEDDNGDKLTFELSDPSGSFRIDTSSGKIYTAGSLDLDQGSKPVRQISVDVMDGVYKNSAQVTINIKHENEFEPTLSGPLRVSLPENATEGTQLAQISAHDNDTDVDGVVTFSLLKTPGSDLFKIDPKTGIISLNCSKCLDFSLTKRYDLVIMVQDGGTPQMMELTTLQIDIKEIFLSPPLFSRPTYTVTIDENEKPRFLIQLEAFDSDTPTDKLTYGLVNTPSSRIEVFPNGSVFSKREFDAEIMQSFKTEVRVSDGNNEDTAMLEVIVEDVNDNTPVLNVSSLNLPLKVPENENISEVVTVLGATDKDVSNTGFTFWFEDGTDGKFRIDPDIGVVTVSGRFDRRLKKSYNMTVYVSDHGQPPLDSVSYITVDITDSNTAPQFVDSSGSPVLQYIVDVLENATVGQILEVLHAVDPDHGSSGQLSFGIDGGNQDQVFLLDKDNGNLTLNKPLNFELKQEYRLHVHVRDHSLDPGTGTATVTVNVLNVIEAPRWPLPLPTVYIMQTTTCDSQVTAFSREVTSVSSYGDEDVQYKIQIDPESAFKINKTTGLLKNTKKLTPGQYHIVLSACSGNSSVCSDANITVVVQNDNVLAFCPPFLTVQVNESIATGEVIFDLNTTKGDTQITYNITDGNSDGLFDIETNTGKIQVKSPLDREVENTHTLYVRAKESSTGQTADAQVIVLVQDVDDTPPEFRDIEYLGEISEAASVKDPVLIKGLNRPLNVEATDPDESSKVTYYIDHTQDDSNGSFDVSSSGQVELAKPLDYESMTLSQGKKLYTFTVVATDGSREARVNVSVEVIDANDNVPKFANDSYIVSVLEDVNVPKDLIELTATDKDSLDVGELRYGLDLIDPVGVTIPFTINDDGRVVIQRTLDREIVSQYKLNVTVTDTAGQTDFTTLTVVVKDTNDNNPVFDPDSYSFNVTEGLELRATPGQVYAGKTTTLVVNCSFPRPPPDVTNIMSLVISRSTDESGTAFAELASINAFNPNLVYREQGLGHATVTGAVYRTLTDTSSLIVEWEYPESLSRTYRCEANTLNIHGHTGTHITEVDVIGKGWMTCTYILHELQSLAVQTKTLSRANKQLEGENQVLRDLVFYQSGLYGTTRYLMAKSTTEGVDESITICKAMGGHLAQIEDGSEYNFVRSFVYNYLPDSTQVYISGTNAGHSFSWVYHGTDDPVQILDWMQGDPISPGPLDNCLALMMYQSMIKMRAIACDNPRQIHHTSFLCELPGQI